MITTERAKEILDAFEGKRILVLGDLMLDEYIWGKATRVSPEAPVVIVDADKHTFVPGGAANVVNNICSLGAQAVCVGVVGEDDAGTTLRRRLLEAGADASGVVSVEGRPTTLKTRVIAQSQQILRVDHEVRDPVSTSVRERLLAYVARVLPNCDALLLSDYQKGLFSKEFISSVMALTRETGKVVVGDLKPSSLAARIGATALIMNTTEAGAASGFLLSDDSNEGSLRDASRILMRKTGAQYVLITRGPQGQSLFPADGEPISISVERLEVFDVAGAADTVLSTLPLALASGASPDEALALTTAAASVVVRKVGVATVTRAELEAAALAVRRASPFMGLME